MAATELSEFQRDLRSLIGKPSHLRPFVCDGSPLECGVFIVGFNPATGMPGDFWRYWDPKSGFRKQAWFAAYQKHRERHALAAGKQYRPVSNTRRVIDWILEEVRPLRCLETNIYSAATAKAIELTKGQQYIAPFEFLLERIKPPVVVMHGKKAAEAVQQLRMAGCAHLICVPHFSRGWWKVKAHALGRQIREMCAPL
jgi:hypothetical protein